MGRLWQVRTCICMLSCFCREGGSAARQRTGQHAGGCGIVQNGGGRKQLRALRVGMVWGGLGLGVVRRAHAIDGGMGSPWEAWTIVLGWRANAQGAGG